MLAAVARDGADLILSLPEDVLALISAHLQPRDLLALSGASRRLRRALSADKAWLAQCRRLLPSPAHLLAWRAAAAGDSLAVCRFLHSAAPLLGLWAHQNPELGNLVATVPGFLSVVAARAIPQELATNERSGASMSTSARLSREPLETVFFFTSAVHPPCNRVCVFMASCVELNRIELFGSGDGRAAPEVRSSTKPPQLKHHRFCCGGSSNDILRILVSKNSLSSSCLP